MQESELSRIIRESPAMKWAKAIGTALVMRSAMHIGALFVYWEECEHDPVSARRELIERVKQAEREFEEACRNAEQTASRN